MPLEPGTLGASLAALATGFGFGFALERGGLADARRLAAQFYLTDVRVLKVMFTAIVVAMLGVYGLAGIGLVDVNQIFVNPTNLWPGILGGLVLGFGFILGGYCPGTSLLAAATLKLDAIVFVGGALIGVFAFGETVGLYDAWYRHSGAYGRLTLPELFSWDAGLLVLGVVLMALAAFWAGERAEDRFGPAELRESPRHLRRLAPVLVVAGVLVAAIGGPTAEARLRWEGPDLDARLARREVHIDPGELLGLMHNYRVALRIVDVRDEADFNLFHLLNAERLPLLTLPSRTLDLPATAIVVVVANDEQRAQVAWKVLQVQGFKNAYVLAGGVNHWLDVFREGKTTAPTPQQPDAQLRHSFPRALGDRWPSSRPPATAAEGRTFETKAKVAAPASLAGGGCG